MAGDSGLWLWLACLCAACAPERPTAESEVEAPEFKSPFSLKEDNDAMKGPALLPNDFLTLPSGIEFSLERPGYGENPKSGQKVAVNYAGYLEDGTKFDANMKGRPFVFVMGNDEVIDGWEHALPLFKTGTRAWLKIPSHMAYGEQGSPPKIPSNARLIFFVELVKIYE